MSQILLEKWSFERVNYLNVLDLDVINYLPKTKNEIKINELTTGVNIEKFKPLEKAKAKNECYKDL